MAIYSKHNRPGSEICSLRQIGALEEELGIESFTSQRADTYSAGMLQQLAFARALLGEAKGVMDRLPPEAARRRTIATVRNEISAELAKR